MGGEDQQWEVRRKVGEIEGGIGGWRFVNKSHGAGK